MFVNPYHINRTLEGVFEETFQPYHHESFRFHIYTYIHITTFMLFVS